MKTTETGRIGERAVCSHLMQQGYTIIVQNYRRRGGEIDIIAENGEHLVFVEVKTRRAGSMVSPMESITRTQQVRIIRTAMAYCAEQNADWRLQPRFDAAAVVLTGQRVISLDYVENAFDTTGLDEIL